ncbi:HEPN domain protein [Clostridium tepidiprofundi DSM 19306]|uniref:HEPN domain protein n=1 Tax=Clostridium tepidiprofundi DSM 19306 TaxID=1121338 RepID=A0A151B7I5_9CLOT|nr:HEPN domain-containing protein [Clostridium tepidiprofundi]KYH35607.1 HEPN domain protein [Clostridium tepidiprofundi DSM 19306]
MVDTTRPNELFSMGDKDLRGAKILYEYDGDYGLVCFHLQQAVEKYLKGFLICNTGILQSGHNLFRLCKIATRYDKNMNKFLKDCAFLNAYYIETRYPAEEPLIASREDVEEGIKIAEKIIKYIQNSTIIRE